MLKRKTTIFWKLRISWIGCPSFFILVLKIGRNHPVYKKYILRNGGEILNVAAAVAEAICDPAFQDFCVMYCFICLDCFPVSKSFLYFPARKVTDDCISGGHVSHVRKNRRNDARTKRFSTNTWKYHNTKRDKKSSTSF